MVSRSWELATACFLSGIFIDLDHVIDFFILFGRPFTIKRFFHVFYGCRFDRIYLFFHAWEWLIILFAASWLTGWNPWLTGALIGVGHHMVLDLFNNGGYFRSYFIIWRWKNQFDFATTFPGLCQNRDNPKLPAEAGEKELRVKN